MKCDIPSVKKDESFDELLEGFQEQSYWVRLFMRPCCPAPGESTARGLIEHLKDDLDARADFTDEQRAQLKAIADERLEWYLKLPVSHTA